MAMAQGNFNINEALGVPDHTEAGVFLIDF